MTLERQQKIDKAANICKAIFAYSFVINLCLFLLIRFIIVILNKLGIDITTMSGYTEIASVYEICCLFVVVITIAALLSIIILSFWTTDEEKEQRKEEIREALREEQEAQAKKKRDYMPPRETPLIGLSEKQEGIINSLLLDIPIVKGHLKTSELIQILRALAGQGDLDDSDKDALIYWVEKVTGKEVDVRNFKYDYDSKFSEKGVIKWGNTIRAKFDAIENS